MIAIIWFAIGAYWLTIGLTTPELRFYASASPIWFGLAAFFASRRL